MSRCYSMAVEISGFDKDRAEEVKTAAKGEWDFADWDVFDAGALFSCADGSLGGGESEEEFTERLSVAVWRANGRFCKVEVNATYLEELPCETHELGEDDYERLKAKIELSRTPANKN